MTNHEDFASLLGEFEQKHTETTQQEPKVGDKVRGTVVSIQGDSVFVDLGAKTEGVVDVEELTGAQKIPSRFRTERDLCS